MKRCFSCFKEFNESLSVCPYCGHVEITKAEEPIYLAPGTMLANRYIVGEVVGAGGFGIVYKAWDTKLETIVAVKEFFISRLVTRAEVLNLTEGDSVRYTVELQACPHFGTRIDPITGDEFLRRIQP